MSSMLLVAVIPSGSAPMTSPTSRPALSGECTQQPTSSSSGCSSTPLMAAMPTPPVAHCTTRKVICQIYTRCGSPEWIPGGSAAEMGDLISAVGVAGPDRLLVVLADAGPRDLLDEGPAFRQPPPDHFVGQEFSKLLGGGLLTFVQHDRGQRAFLPPVVGHADDGGLPHLGMADQVVLQLHRRDPFAAGLDDVLGAVGQRDVALCVHPAHIAAARPSALELRRVRVVVVAAGDPAPAAPQVAPR